jgi:hypothetical protein
VTNKILKISAAAYLLASLAIIPIPALAKEKPASVTYDPYTKNETITGQVHNHNALLDLDKWDYWLSASVTSGIPMNPVLMFSTDTPSWYFFDHAFDSDGNELPVIKGARGLSSTLAGDVHEVFGVQLTPKYLADHRTAGFNFKIMGSGGARVVIVPPEALATFETTYLAEVEKVGGFRNDLAAAQTAVAPTPGQIVQAAMTGAAAMSAKGGLGVSFAMLPQGCMLIVVAPGSRAERGKLKPGQLVTAINGKSIAGMTQADVLAILKGSSGVTTFAVAGLGDLAVGP